MVEMNGEKKKKRREHLGRWCGRCRLKLVSSFGFFFMWIPFESSPISQQLCVHSNILLFFSLHQFLFEYLLFKTDSGCSFVWLSGDTDTYAQATSNRRLQMAKIKKPWSRWQRNREKSEWKSTHGEHGKMFSHGILNYPDFELYLHSKYCFLVQIIQFTKLFPYFFFFLLFASLSQRCLVLFGSFVFFHTFIR